ncbi:uncharacterized mitochondrial protein AtMg00810-like [Arachis hypogaea]|uniref:uncharacterized mitochondrial protein AtMg00810-like n=1 Tax=Arachis hypogaea TaxID=3818 RepID=UPI003B215F76
MAQEFEMSDMGLMSYYLGIEVKQIEDRIFISQQAYAKELLKKLNMLDCNPTNTPMECGVKLFKEEEGVRKVDQTLFRSLMGSLRYLTCTRADILFSVGLVSRYMENPTETHMKAAKRILCYLRGTLEYGVFYSVSDEFKLMGYCDSDYAGDIDDRKNTTIFVFFLENNAISWCSKKQPIVTLSTCEAEYVVATTYACHAIWLKILLKKLHFEQVESTKIMMKNKSAIALAKNPVFHDRSKHIETKYHFICNVLRTCMWRLKLRPSLRGWGLTLDIFAKLKVSQRVFDWCLWKKEHWNIKSISIHKQFIHMEVKCENDRS